MIWLMPTLRNGQPAGPCFHCFNERGGSLCGDWTRQPGFDPLERTKIAAPRLCATCRRRVKKTSGVVWEEA